MDIQSRPELEDLVRYDVDYDAHQSSEQQVEHAVSILHAHEKWSTEDRRAENVEA